MDPRKLKMDTKSKTKFARRSSWNHSTVHGVDNSYMMSNIITVASYNKMKQPESCQEDYFHQEVKVLLGALQLLGAFPLRITSSDVPVFQLFSSMTVYSILLYVLNAGFTFLALTDHYANLLKSTSLNDRIYIIILMTFLTTTLYLPLLSWFDLKRTINYLNEWKQFQRLFWKVTNKRTDVKLRTRCIRALAISALMSFHPIIMHFYYPYMELWKLPLYSISTMATFTVTFFKVVIFKALWISGEKLNICFKQDLKERGPTPEIIAKYRHLWLQWSQLVSQEGYVMGTFYGLFMLVLLFIHILGLYSFLMGFRAEEIDIWWQVNTISPCLCSAITLYAICNGGYQLSVMGVEVKNHLLVIAPIYTTHHVMAEVEAFLNVITMSPPEASVVGFSNLDRRLFTAFVSAMVTYMVVLLQFDDNSGSKAQQ